MHISEAKLDQASTGDNGMKLMMWHSLFEQVTQFRNSLSWKRVVLNVEMLYKFKFNNFIGPYAYMDIVLFFTIK